MASAERRLSDQRLLQERLHSRPDLITGNARGRVAVIVEEKTVYAVRLDQKGEGGVVGASARTTADAKRLVSFQLGVPIPSTEQEKAERRKPLQSGEAINMDEYPD